jgi:uncharacterized protein
MSDTHPVMRKFPVPGTIVREWIIAAKGYDAFVMKKGEVLRFVDIEGKQVPDLVCFDVNDHGECINLGNSVLLNKRREFVKGNALYSITCKKMMTIVDYSNEMSYA